MTERGAAWLDAPVSGSTALAERGALTILAGGDAEILERVRPVLESMGQTIFHLGGTGSGAAMKVVLQGVLSVINESIAEGLVLAERSGIVRETAYDVFAGGAVASPYVQYKRGAFLDRRRPRSPSQSTSCARTCGSPSTSLTRPAYGSPSRRRR